MTALPQHRMTADEFLAWAETVPKEAGRFELWDGQVIVKRGPTGQQQSERARHWDAKFAIAAALKVAVRNSKLPCFAVPEGAGLRLTNDRVVEPDAMVYCGQRVQPDALYVPNPIIVVEVLSPSTASFDHGLKLREYFKLDSVHLYLIIDPAARLIIQHSRGTGDAWMTRIVAEQQLRLDPPGLDIDLAELFETG
jgi:Uma2 family endonuclease